MDQALQPTADRGWVLVEDGYDPLRESSLESRFAISNGFLGVRGGRATTQGSRRIAPASTYVAGLFDSTGAVPALVPAPGWLNVRLFVGDRLLAPHPGDIAVHRITLDMKRGLLLTEWRSPDQSELGLRIRTARLVSLSQRGIGLQLLQLEMKTGDIEVTLRAACEGLGAGMAPSALEQDLGVWQTLHSDMGLAMASAVSLEIDKVCAPSTPVGPFEWSWTWTTCPGQVVSLVRLVALTRSAGHDPDLGARTRAMLAAAQGRDWRGVVADHERAWTERWRSSEVEVDGDPAAQTALRFALYHLNGAANPDDEHVSIGARALTGDDYLGHVFWDTEIYLLPFYSLTWPEAARALLMYRYNTLDAARAKAARLGWRGALYAWESADTGAEASPAQVIAPDRQVVDILGGAQEQHISADVAYAVWQYWQVTGDEEFLLAAGAEILLETARFWASRAEPDADGIRHIRGVIGPDEYHQHIDDNAFTNVMAQWNIRRGLDVAALMRARWPGRWSSLSPRLGVDDAELKAWREAADTIATGLDVETGLYEQFSGYFGLEPIDLSVYAGRSVPMDVVLGRARTQGSQVIKQADVVALLGLLPEAFPGNAARKNFRYYEPRCGQGSSLSAAFHGLVAARLGDGEMALRYFRHTAAIDLTDTTAADAGGVHIAALGGLWMMTVFGFAGLSLHSDGIALDPCLPPGWTRLGFPLQWRGRRIRIAIDQIRNRLDATLEDGAEMTVVVAGARYSLRTDQPLSVAVVAPHPTIDRTLQPSENPS